MVFLLIHLCSLCTVWDDVTKVDMEMEMESVDLVHILSHGINGLLS